MSHFDFKQFRIYHDRCAMKVGTDGVLLGAWANVTNSKNILDIGTGTGLIAIMLAQRCDAKIRAIDIDKSSVEQAEENVAACPFKEQIRVAQDDIMNWDPQEKFDNIVSNPPYFTEETLPPDLARSAARHTAHLTFEALVTNAQRLMLPDALFQVILPYTSVNRFITICALHGLSLLKRTDVCTKSGKPFKRSLLCFINNIDATCPKNDILPLSGAGGGRSEEYQELTKDYYL